MKKILIINAYYYPGWRSGGPQQTIMNVTEVFGERSELYILTHNHDLGESEPYPDLRYDVWTDVGKAKVYYSSKDSFSASFLRKTVNQFDLVFLCGPYCDYSYKVLLLNKMNCIKAKVVLAPMGSLSQNALRQKQLKKKIFWAAFRVLGLHKNMMWSFTSELEKKDAASCLGEKRTGNYYIAEDLPRCYQDLAEEKRINKRPGALKIVFLSRICPMKNLHQAIDIVSKLDGDITFDIYGTKEDPEYWTKCEKALTSLRSNVTWKYCDAVPSEKVVETFLRYDLFLLPTLGENFGHVVYEALMAGCLPVISDKTPWNDLEDNGCGWSIPLEHTAGFVERVQQYVDMDETQLKEQAQKAMQYAENKYRESVQKSGYDQILC